MVAIVGVRTFGIGRPVLRYAERVVSHDAALGLLADRRARVFEALVPSVPGALPRRRGRAPRPRWFDDVVLVGGSPASGAPTRADGAGRVLGCGAVRRLEESRGRSHRARCRGVGVAAWMISRLASARAERAFIAARADLSDLVERTARDRQQLRLWRAGSATLRSLDQVGGALGAAASTAAGGVAIARGLRPRRRRCRHPACGSHDPRRLGRSRDSCAPGARRRWALFDAIAPLAHAGALSVRTASGAQQRLDAIVGARPRVTESPNAIPATGIVPLSYSLRDVTAGWGRLPRLRGLDLSIPSGERHALVGPSGSGSRRWRRCCRASSIPPPAASAPTTTTSCGH